VFAFGELSEQDKERIADQVFRPIERRIRGLIGRSQ
jgi:hypothetical protein